MKQDCPIIDLRGDATARGHAHGEAARELIARHIEGWREAAAKQTGRPYREVGDALLGGTHFPAAAHKWTPALWTELQAIAAGAAQTFEDVLLLNLTDEQWWFFAEKKAEACTSFAYLDETGAVWSGQNLDITGWMDGLQIVLRYDIDPSGNRPDGTAIIAGLAGTIGMSGINSFGLSICCNTLLQLPPTAHGLPCLFVIRGFLEQPDLGRGEAFLRQVTHASGLHYLTADPGGWLGVECDATGVRAVASAADSYAHTNHPKLRPETASRSSTDRLAAMTMALQDGRGLDALTLGPICRDGSSPVDPIGFTIFSARWKNEPHAVATIAPGPPSRATYRDIASLAPAATAR